MGWLSAGLLAGVVYGVVDTAADVHLLHTDSVLALNVLHRFFNVIAPPVAGMVVALLFAYMRQRDALVQAERRVSVALRDRLDGMERQQAVWLLASSLLHDIRNPLHALGLLLDEACQAGPGSGPIAALLDKARTNADRIEARIGSLRDLAESPPRTRARVSVTELARSVAQDLAEVAAGRSVALEVEAAVSVTVHADERCVRTPLENLVLNAIDAAAGTAGGGRVTVRVSPGGGGGSVLVRDNGPGIPQGLEAEVFEPLRTGKRHGLGLGLPLARALARLDGGDVRLVSHGPGGTTFELVLPDEQSR
jgi:signal transduction histidine kinase